MIVLYDHHEDEAPIKVNQTKHGLSLHIDKHLRNGHNGRVYPVVCVEGCPSSLDTELLDLKELPSVVHDTRTDVGSYITSPIIPWLLGPEEEYNARSLNFETAQSGYCSDELFLDGKGPLYDVEQIHLDPDLFSAEGIRNVFGVDLNEKFFYSDRGNRDGSVFLDLLGRKGSELDLLGVFEFYGNLANGKEEKNKIYKAIITLLDKADFKPKNLAIDPTILDTIPDLGGICKNVVGLCDYDPNYDPSEKDRIDPSMEPKLYKYPKVFAITMSHYSAALTFDWSGIENLIAKVENTPSSTISYTNH